jgi:hypothetical protein
MEQRPWRRAVAWLAFLGPFFFASYGFANWLASRRTGVGSVAFTWERSIPFVPWTIVPYWSIDLLYALSPFLCTTRRELDRHAQRLLTVQVVSVVCFIVWPLRFSFPHPAATGLFGALFIALGSFDKPFNQAPSLHIALLVVIWVCLARHCPARWRWLLHSWMALIGVSVLTTYQHHFIDLPTGLAVGFAALWILPDEGTSPLTGMELTRDPRRLRLAAFYAIGAITLAVLSTSGGIELWLLWPATALVIVALNYAAIGVRGFQKSDDGRLRVAAWGLLLPYIAGAWLNSRLWTRLHPGHADVIDGVSIGRIPSGRDLARSTLAAVVDLAAELPCGSRADLFYRSIPVLDLTVPDVETLRETVAAIEEARRHGSTLVCCGLGYSRSAIAVIAWLLSTHRAETIEKAVSMVRSARPAIVLRSEHRAMLGAFC